MSASNEWRDWHLTPDGWIKGSYKYEGPSEEISPPDNRVRTDRYREFMSYGLSPISKITTTEWSSPDHEAITRLMKQFGRCPQDL